MATLWREIPVSSTQTNGKQVAVGVWVCDLCCALSLPLGPPHAPVHVHETLDRGALARDEHTRVRENTFVHSYCSLRKRLRFHNLCWNLEKQCFRRLFTTYWPADFSKRLTET
jgi:hypothetical protein